MGDRLTVGNGRGWVSVLHLSELLQLLYSNENMWKREAQEHYTGITSVCLLEHEDTPGSPSVLFSVLCHHRQAPTALAPPSDLPPCYMFPPHPSLQETLGLPGPERRAFFYRKPTHSIFSFISWGPASVDCPIDRWFHKKYWVGANLNFSFRLWILNHFN